MSESIGFDVGHDDIVVRKPNLSVVAAQYLNVFQQASRLLGSDLLSAPVWEALLILRVVGIAVSEERLRNALNMPEVSLVRWLRVLEHGGLIASSTRNGQQWYKLTDRASDGLDQALMVGLSVNPGLPMPVDSTHFQDEQDQFAEIHDKKDQP